MPVNRTDDEKKIKRYAEIVRPEIIQERLLALRKAYNFTLEEMSGVTENLMTRATLNSWETGVRVPAIDGLQIISACFGTSIDWICGMSEIPYTEESIRIAKQFFIDSLKDTHTKIGISKSKIIEIINQTDYSPEVLANIMVLYRCKFIFDNLKSNLKGAKLGKSLEIKNKIATAVKTKQPVCRIQRTVKIDYY